jgi:hypothetical protein
MLEVPLLENGLFTRKFVKNDPFGHVSKRPYNIIILEKSFKTCLVIGVVFLICRIIDHLISHCDR